MEEVARIVLGLETHDVAEEVMHFIDRTGRARVVATAEDERQLAEAVRQLEPDAVLASPALVRSGEAVNGSVLLVVDTQESVRSLRDAIRAGARGFYVWPADREELAGAAARTLPPTHADGRGRALAIAVYGPRGGVGATFLATHLAAAFSRRKRDCILIDLDLWFGDVRTALGSPNDPGLRTMAEAVQLGRELSVRHLQEILWSHPDGFRVLHAPADQHGADRVRASDSRVTIEAVRNNAEAVVLHVPRPLDEFARAGLEAADRVLVVLTLDVLAFRDAKRALELLPSEVRDRCGFVVNKAARSEITPSDVERVFGCPPIGVLPVNRSIAALQDRGRLLPKRGRCGRAIDRLSKKVLEGSP